MSNLSSSLKQWGAQGSEYPNGYSYLEGEQPIDQWDNFLTYNIIEEIHALQSVVNGRMESDVTGGGSHPSSPEVGHMSHRVDTSNLPSSDEATFVYDETNSVWHRLMQADGDKMTGVLDMGGYKIHDSTGTLTLGGEVNIPGTLQYGGSEVATQEWVNNNADVPNADYADSAGDAETLAGKSVDSLIVPSGVITMWSGTSSDIPNGWTLCDGTDGTPDLRDRFIVGAGGKYAPSDTGGAEQVQLTEDELPSHSHDYEQRQSYTDGESANDFQDFSGGTATRTTTETGGDQAHENRPPYFALAFIMKE